MTLTAHQLARLLLAGPDLEVTTWDPREGEQSAIEQIVATDLAVVLGMDIAPSWTVDGAEIVWAADDSARRGLENAQARWARAKLEWVG